MVNHREWQSLRAFLDKSMSAEAGTSSTVSIFLNQQFASVVSAHETVTVLGRKTVAGNLDKAIFAQMHTDPTMFEVQLARPDVPSYPVDYAAWTALQTWIEHEFQHPEQVVMIFVNLDQWMLEVTNYERQDRRTAIHPSLRACMELFKHTQPVPIDPSIQSHGDLLYANFNPPSNTTGREDQGYGLRITGSREDDTSSTS